MVDGKGKGGGDGRAFFEGLSAVFRSWHLFVFAEGIIIMYGMKQLATIDGTKDTSYYLIASITCHLPQLHLCSVPTLLVVDYPELYCNRSNL